MYVRCPNCVIVAELYASSFYLKSRVLNDGWEIRWRLLYYLQPVSLFGNGVTDCHVKILLKPCRSLSIQLLGSYDDNTNIMKMQWHKRAHNIRLCTNVSGEMLLTLYGKIPCDMYMTKYDQKHIKYMLQNNYANTLPMRIRLWMIKTISNM
jgi:hypothetical protein